MKNTFTFILFLVLYATTLQGQYTESFDLANKGILSGPCGNSDPTSCLTVDFSGVNWTLGGDLSGIDAEGFKTENGHLLSEDLDEVACWISPTLDISAAGTVSFSATIVIPTGAVWESSSTTGSIDFVDVKYSVDGGAFVTLPNITGCPGSGHTISSSGCGFDLTGPLTYNPTISGLNGSTLDIQICFDSNSSEDDGWLEEVNVPQAGVTLLSEACTPTLNGLNVTQCPNTPTGEFTIEADGELNGADAWYIKLIQGGETCGTFTASGGFSFTESFSNNFTLPDSEYVVFAFGDCVVEQVCYVFTPRELFGIPSFSLTTTTYNELDGIQTGLGGATPSGGTYSGPGVTDDGNGMTFSFDPAAAGVGNHSITYTTGTNNGACSNLSTSVSVTVVAASITFPALGTVCEGSGVQTITGGATPVGGVYSGSGVTDNGNGTSFTFDPGITGVGSTSVSYAIGSSTASSTLTVAALPTVTFTSSLSTVSEDAGLQTSISGGSPAGGIYSGPGVTDDGNGMSFSFDPAAAGTGEVIVTYTFTDSNGCSDNQSDIITVEAAQLPGDICPDAIDINVLFTGPLNEAVVSTTQDNTGYNADNDPGAGYECWFGDEPLLNNTIWYAFTGDGDKYSIRSIACGDNPMINTDTQFALYSGDCATPIAVACNDDEDFDNQVYNSYMEIETEPGVEYLLMVDGYVAAADYAAIGNFCLEVTLLETVGVTDLANTDLRLFPNPTSGEVQLPALTMERVEVYDLTGKLVLSNTQVEGTLDLTAQPAGLYLLKIYAAGEVYSAKVVKQ